MSASPVPEGDVPPPDTIDLDVAARLLAGASLGARRARPARRAAWTADAEPPPGRGEHRPAAP